MYLFAIDHFGSFGLCDLQYIKKKKHTKKGAPIVLNKNCYQTFLHTQSQNQNFFQKPFVSLIMTIKSDSNNT